MNFEKISLEGYIEMECYKLAKEKRQLEEELERVQKKIDNLKSLSDKWWLE